MDDHTKAPVLHAKSACFALQYRLFCNGKEKETQTIFVNELV